MTTPTRTSPAAPEGALRPLAAPALALALAAGGTWWAWPHGLPVWRSLAILSAWAGTGLLVASLVLMVREPRLAALMGGLDTMYRWHHKSGTGGYLLLLVHPLCLAAAGWAESPATAWQAIAPWTLSWPEWLGWGGLLLLMAGLAATFAARLPYRRWRALHDLTGAGAVLGLAHIYALLGGESGVVALLAVAGVALAWRLLGSDLGLAARPFRVTRVAQRAADLIEATLAPCAAPLAVAPGQFLLAAFGDGPGYQGCREFHPFTVSGMAADGSVNISVKALGACTRQLQSLAPGVLVRLQGPFGHFLAEGAAAPQLWVAGGVGITPFVAALRSGGAHTPTTLIYLYRSARDAAFVDELQALAAADAQLTLLAHATGDAPPNLDELLAQVPRLAERQVQVCGPPALVTSLKTCLERHGVAPAAIHYESFDFR